MGTPGAEAILKLRAIRSNGYFPAYWDYHLAQGTTPQPQLTPRRPRHPTRGLTSLQGSRTHLKPIYTAVDRDHAWDQLEAFAEKWDHRYPMISTSWTEHWEQVVPFLAFAPEVRRAVYTTNTIEALNRQIRKVIKTRGSFPDEDSARKLLYLAITRAQRKWRHTYNWSSALTAFRIHFGDRIPRH